MLPPEHPDCIQIAFDDHRLVANAGLLSRVACPTTWGWWIATLTWAATLGEPRR